MQRSPPKIPTASRTILRLLSTVQAASFRPSSDSFTCTHGSRASACICSRHSASPDSERSHGNPVWRSEEHTSELQSLMRISYAVFCLKKKKTLTLQTKQQSTT